MASPDFTNAPFPFPYRGLTSAWLYPQAREDGVVHYKQIDFTPGMETVLAYFCPRDPNTTGYDLDSETVTVCRLHGHYRDQGWRADDV